MLRRESVSLAGTTRNGFTSFQRPNKRFPAWRQTMRSFFYCATLSSVLAFTSSVSAADGVFTKSFDTDAMTNANDDSVIPASCELGLNCSDHSDSNACSSNCGVKPMKLNCNACDCGNWLQNTTAFSGVEAFKTYADFAYSNNAGFVNGLNTGFRLGDSKIRGQIGGSFGVYDLKGRVDGGGFNTVNQQTENQGFLTAGVFKRSNVCAGERLSWGLVYDQLWNHQYGVLTEDIYLGQFRGILGVALNQTDEVGFWGTAGTNTANTTDFTGLRAVNQGNLFWSHHYAYGARSMVYAGLADRASNGTWTTGTQLTAPMSQRVSLYGNSAFMFPSSSKGTNFQNGLVGGAGEILWSVSCGLSFSFGRKSVSRNISGDCGMPLLPVANNGTFMVDGDINPL